MVVMIDHFVAIHPNLGTFDHPIHREGFWTITTGDCPGLEGLHYWYRIRWAPEYYPNLVFTSDARGIGANESDERLIIYHEDRELTRESLSSIFSVLYEEMFKKVMRRGETGFVEPCPFESPPLFRWSRK